jgi:predicted ATP-binding protein involved in virulence
MRIEQLHLENIGVFDSLDLQFQPCKQPGKAEIHIFAGENGTGKTTLLYALAAAFTSNKALILKRFRNIKESWVELKTVDQAYQYSEDTPSSLPSLFYTQSTQPLEYEDLIHHYKKNVFQLVVFAYAGNRSLTSHHLVGIKEITDSPFEGSLSFHSTDSLILMQWIANNKAKAALAQVKNDPQKAAKYQTAIHLLEAAITEIVGFQVEFELESEPEFKVELKINGQTLEFEVLPDGLKSIISWISDLFMRMDRIPWIDDCSILKRRFILFLDEIDIHLHPVWQRKILPVVQKLFPNAQIFVSSHSPFVVASVSDAYVYQFRLENGVSRLETVEESKAGSSYSLVLNDIFTIDELFDIETESQFDHFYQLEDDIIQGHDEKIPLFLEVARQLMEKGIESREIVGIELRQISIILNKEFSV